MSATPVVQGDVESGSGTVRERPRLEQAGSGQRDVSFERSLSATGAIPKSISFDKTAEQGGDRDVSDSVDSKNKRSFFKNFKIQVGLH